MSPAAATSGDQLLIFLYHEVRAIARQQLARERPDHTLNATALVNELYLRLAASDRRFAADQEFLPVVSRMMRRIMVDYARSRNRLKRGGGQRADSIDAMYIELPGAEAVEVETLDDALTALAEIGPRQAQVVELRFFGGLSVDETAAALSISTKTVCRDWSMARAWLRSNLADQKKAPK